VNDIEHELIATLWDLKVAKDRIDKLTKSNLQLREGAEEQKQRIKRLEREVEVLRLYGNKDCTAMADEALSKEAKP
jgi:hypothetical protein